MSLLPLSDRSPLPGLSPSALGSEAFRKEYGLRLAYVAGAMFKAIASTQMVIRMARAGLLSYFGSGGLRLDRLEEEIAHIKSQLRPEQPFGVNLLCNLVSPAYEEQTVAVLLEHDVRRIEAAAFMQMTPSLVWFRLKGVRRLGDGRIDVPRRVMAKVSRPEVAEAFLAPAPEELVQRLVEQGRLTAEEAVLGRAVPMADAICVESDSGGHTDQGVAFALIPTMLRLRDAAMARREYARPIFLGAAGGIGTPEAAAAALILGADYVLTGSINQCTVEAGTSDAVKDMLQQAAVQDTTYVPAGDMFEIGARAQVFRRGVLFPARANRLYDLYKQHDSLDALDAATRRQIEEKYFGRSFDEVWRETREFYNRVRPETLARAERNPKQKMALIFRWYFTHTNRLAQRGDAARGVDFQIHCGPALGAFNQWVKGTPLESWRNRHVDEIGVRIMEGAADLLERRYRAFFADGHAKGARDERIGQS
jgi:trans-AT polyketide synthase/acyltransferase/oxidoreductase domain-containing protein